MAGAGGSGAGGSGGSDGRDARDGTGSSLKAPILIVAAAASIMAGIWLARGATERAESRSGVPLRADCTRFPGACGDAPTGEAATVFLSEERESDSLWAAFRNWEERARARGLWSPRADDSLARLDATLRGAIADARVVGDPAAIHRAIAMRSALARTANADLADREREAVSAEGEGVSGPNVVLGAPLAAEGRLDVTFLSGAIRVIGWDRDSVHVRGRMSPGERMVVVEKSDEVNVAPMASDTIDDGASEAVGSTLHLQVDGLPRGLAAASELELHLPHGADVTIRAVNGSFVVEEFDGALTLATRTGNVLVAPTRAGTVARRLVLHSLTGALTVPAVPYAELVTGTGRVIVGDTAAPEAAPGAELRITAGRGPVHVAARDAAVVEAASVLGDVHFIGSVREAADLASHAGAVRLDVAATSADAAAPRVIICDGASSTPDCDPSRRPFDALRAAGTVVRASSVRGGVTRTGQAP